jgi:hypothetical protein
MNHSISLLSLLIVFSAAPLAAAQEGKRLVLQPSMIENTSGFGEPEKLIDEQDFAGPFVAHAPKTMLAYPGSVRDKMPAHFVIDLGEEKHLSDLALYDMNGHGELIFEIGEPGDWTRVYTDDGVGYKKWKPREFMHTTRYLRITKPQPEGLFGELLLWEQTPAQRQARKQRAVALEKAQREKAKRPMVDAGGPFGELPLVQEVHPAADDSGVEFMQSTGDATRVETILGTQTRVMPHGDQPAYFAYRLGKYKLLEPGKAYLLAIDFPEDAARSFTIANRGGEFIHGIHTGQALGDVIFTYTNNNLESLDVPLSGEMQTFRQLFYLSDRTGPIRLMRNPEPRPNEAEDGFWVIFTVSDKLSAPLSKGAAIARIRLFEVPEPEQYDQPLTLPPDDLPHRHVFFREEMGDLSINSAATEERAFADPIDNYRYKARLQKFLGMNTMAKDLLEFGATQGWDTGSSDWYYAHKFPDLWQGVIAIAAEEGLNLLPYYEYAGAKGRLGLGFEQRAEPLSGRKDFTHIRWSESARADLTDPDTIEDFKKVLQMTILRHRDKADFVGAWLRPRVSQMPIGFADTTRERFAREKGRATTPTRMELRDDASLLGAYYDWWFEKRKQFLVTMRDYLRENGVEDAHVFYTPHYGEPGPSLFETGWSNAMALVTDQPEKWREALRGEEAYERIKVMPYQEVAEGGWQGRMAKRWPKTWSVWEWHHAAPPADPRRYADTPDIYMTYPFNRLYTVERGSGIGEYAAGGEGIAAIRYYPLNENTRGGLTGYFVADYERPGSLSMIEEARAVAHADVRFLGYLSGYNFNSGFPEASRRFYANFLALPALPGEIVDDAADHPDIVVRRIPTDGHGTFYAVVNTGFTPVEGLDLSLPGGAPKRVVGGRIVDGPIDLQPAELLTLHVSMP